MNVSPVIPFRSSTPLNGPAQENKTDRISYTLPPLEIDTFERSDSAAATNARVSGLIAALLGILALNGANVNAKLQPQVLPSLEDCMVESRREEDDEDNYWVDPGDNDPTDDGFGPRDVFIVEPGTFNLTQLEDGTVVNSSSTYTEDRKDADYKTNSRDGVKIKSEDFHPYFITTFDIGNIKSNEGNRPAQSLEKKAALINELVADYNQIDLEEDDEATIIAKERTALKAAKEALKRTSQYDLPRAREVYEYFLTINPDNYDDEYGMTYGEAVAIQERLISDLERKAGELEMLIQGITEDIA